MGDAERDALHERETVIVERSSSGGLIAAIALIAAAIALLHYFGLLPV